MLRYLNASRLQQAAIVYRYWYDLPAVEDDDLLRVDYAALLRFCGAGGPNPAAGGAPQLASGSAMNAAFHLQNKLMFVQTYHRADNMVLSFTPLPDYRGRYVRLNNKHECMQCE